MLIVIWGHSVRFSTVRKVLFACSHCRVDREGTLRRARRWFTIFFIPVVPDRELGHDVRCGTCKNSFGPRILDVPTTAQRAEQLANAARCGAAAMVRASGNSPASRDAAVAVMLDHHRDYDDGQLDLDLANTTDAQLDAWLTHLSGLLSSTGKERFYSRMTRIALADGVLDDADLTVLDSIGRGLLMTPAVIHGLRDITEHEQTP